MAEKIKVPKKESMHDIYANYQKENSLHKRLEEEGFTTITAVKRTDKKGLIEKLNSYSRGCYKIAIVDGSEIGASPVYLPKPLCSYYVIYVKDTRKRKDQNP